MSMMRPMLAVGRPVPALPDPRVPAQYVWFGCDQRTGAVVEELPFSPGGALLTVIGSYSSVEGSFPIPDAPEGWLRATDPGRTMLVCVRADDNVPVWGGTVIKRTGGSSDLVNLSLVSLEGYLDRRYVSTRTVTQKTAVAIGQLLVQDADSVEGIGFTYDTSAPGDPVYAQPLHDRLYLGDSDQTVYSQLSELMGVQGGAEWTVQLHWRPDGRSFEKRFRIRPRLGTNQEYPAAVFDMPGSVIDYEYSEDFTSSRGANHVESYGEGEGSTRPRGVPARDTTQLTAGWPRYEFRQTVSGVTIPATLTSHSRSALVEMATGARIFTLTANSTWGPRLGTDWVLGDTVAVSIRSSPRHPDGLSLRARVLGAELDISANTISPLLQEDSPTFDGLT